MKKLFLALVLLPFSFYAQVTREIDSLLRLLPDARGEKKASLHSGIGFRYLRIDPVKSYEHLTRALHLADSGNYEKVRIHVLDNLGIYYKDRGSYDEARISFTAALEGAKKLGQKDLIGDVYQDFANMYKRMGVYDTALTFMLTALKIAEEMKDNREQITINTNIGSLYVNREEYDQALKYFQQSIKIAELAGDKTSVAGAIIGMGIVYGSRGDLEKAIGQFEHALKIAEQIPDYTQISTCYSNISTAYSLLGDHDKAIDYKLRTVELKSKLNAKDELADALCTLGSLYQTKGDNKKALDYLGKGIAIAEEIQNKECMRFAYESAAHVYSAMGDHKTAFEYQKKYIEVNKKIYNEQKSKQIAELDARYQSEKKQKELELNEEKLKSKDAQLSQQRTMSYFTVGGLVLALALAFVTLRGYNQKKKAGMLLAQKNAIIEERNKDITDSIYYARRIQEAILPRQDSLRGLFPDSFILFRPRDIVSGDFYWFAEKDGKKLVAAVDCTGHGVPGAFMSMIGNAFLNEVLREKGLTRPAMILSELRHLVINALRQSGAEGETKDGMDIAILSVDEKNGTAEFAGANNPLWLFRQVNGTCGLTEYKPDKRSISYHKGLGLPFSNHTIPLQKGDLLYIFTDGYADQFGGEKGKKFKYRQLQEKIRSVCNLDMVQQAAFLEKTFDDWKGGLEQVDDMLLIGIRI
ncbi:MAG: tetratricopeptide repeat protein [Bacteroidota bacterium]